MDDLVVFNSIVRLEIGRGENEKNQDDGVPEGSEQLGLLVLCGERAGGGHAFFYPNSLRRQSSTAGATGTLDRKAGFQRGTLFFACAGARQVSRVGLLVV